MQIESPRSYLKLIDHKYLLHPQWIRISHWDPIKESLIPFQRMILYSSYIYFVIRSRKQFFLNGEESLQPAANWGEKKELIDQPFPRRIGFRRSVEWSNTDARGDLFMDWTRIVRLRVGLDGTSAGLAQSSYTAANVPGRGSLTMRRANKGEFAIMDGRKAATRRVATCCGTAARGDKGQLGMDSSKKAPHAELSR